MWYLLYNVVLIAASPLILVILLAKKRCRRGLPQRLGFGWHRLTQAAGQDGRPVVWVHAVSLGEVVAVAPLVRQLAVRHPELRLVVSTVTETGREAVQQRLAGIAQHCYAPLDLPWAVSAGIRALHPALYLFVETELWPNVLRMLSQRGVPTIMINGRISSRSFSRQHLPVIRSFYRRMLRSVTCCLVQSDRDGERLVALGAEPATVRRTGNIKFDQPLPAAPAHGQSLSRADLCLADQDDLLVAGSTHPGEEEQVLACYQALAEEFSSLVLVMAPRHVERVTQVEAMVRVKGLSVLRKSAMGGVTGPSGPRVILLDTRGELATIYRFATVAFVGGTLVPIGGHNLLEPAVWGKPVFFGPYTDHCAEVASLLLQAGGGRQISDGTQMMTAMSELLHDRVRLQSIGDAARTMVRDNQGALQRSLDVVEAYLSPGNAAVVSRTDKLQVGLLAGR
jgi:3-deoxy-D-manno-octulosonic-acid transferase